MMAEQVESTAVEFGAENPFWAASLLPYQAPPFDRIVDLDYQPAIEAGIAEHLREVEAIASNPEPATFENTLVALEASGLLLGRVLSAFGAVAGANTNPAIERVQEISAPKLAAYGDAILLNRQLFGRIAQVYEASEALGLDGESMRLLELTYRRFAHSGAHLSEAGKRTLRQWNEEESTLRNSFRSRVLAATREAAYTTTDRAALQGLSQAQLGVAAAAATARGVEGWVLTLQNTTQQPALASLEVRETRRAVYERSWNRTQRSEGNDTGAIVARLAALRAEKAELLGYPSYAAWSLEDQMARTPAAALAFMHSLVPAAVQNARSEAKEIQAVIDAEDGGFPVEPWDWDFYAERVRRARYDLDEAEVRPYFELERVLQDGVFYTAQELFGLRFEPRHDLPVYHVDVRVYEVFDPGGEPLALFYCDWFKRDNKSGGAWMSSFVGQSKLLGTKPVIYNVCNFAKPAEGEPALISFSDVTTMFHEFGHALHGMFSEAVYAELSGTSVPRDFVEFPSQFNERWATYPAVFERFARHYATGEAMPAQMAAKLRSAAKFNEGYARAEVLAAAELDMQWHTMTPGQPVGEVDAFERAALERTGLSLREVPPRYRSSYFSHVFSGGYSAGYYAYLWSQQLDDDAYAWFERHGGLTRANGERLRRMILSRGNTQDLGEIFARFIAD